MLSVTKPLVFALSLLPLALALARALGFAGGLGANPVEALLIHFGDWGLYFLLLTLAVTPLRRLTGLTELARLRRMIGLFAFTYAALHVLVYAGLEHRFALARIVEDIVERPFITAGFAALAILTALAATSTLAARRRLGRRWTQLHRAVYAAGGLAVLHYAWQVKKDLTEALVYAAILAVLLGLRIWHRHARRNAPVAVR